MASLPELIKKGECDALLIKKGECEGRTGSEEAEQQRIKYLHYVRW
jgi:hypothetical protein